MKQVEEAFHQRKERTDVLARCVQCCSVAALPEFNHHRMGIDLCRVQITSP